MNLNVNVSDSDGATEGKDVVVVVFQSVNNFTNYKIQPAIS